MNSKKKTEVVTANKSIMSSQSMSAASQKGEIVLLIMLGIIFCMGLGGHLFVPTRPLMLLSTPYLLLICGLVVFAFTVREQGKALVFWALPTFVLTFALEAFGVATGIIFGDYRYGPVLGTRIWGVPPIIGFNWVLVVLGFSRLVRGTFRIRYAPLGAFLTALLCVLFDFILEPLAIRFEYWIWTAGDVPFKNYAAWFLISYGTALPTWFITEEPKSLILQGYILIQTLFFIFLRLGLAFLS
ncbi:MAG: carotenoid biosynthesis protein [Treponemataceae bacterium]|nr:carotenoid biosynthesis protein [Treponemataceae bacterium]